MHYFCAFVLTILGLVNNLQSVEVNNVTNLWPTGPRVKLEVSPKFLNGLGQGQKLILRKNNESLNLTCTAVHQNAEKSDVPIDYVVDWKVPSHVHEDPYLFRNIVWGQGKNIAWLWFEHLSERNAGDYTCNAVTSKSIGQQFISVTIYLSVKSKPTFCGAQWFRCRSSHCIMERYVCDGKPDCEEGEDENASAGCGPDPCFGKVLCDGRCIPPEWCCNHRNCTGTYGLRPWLPETHEISYVQTAFYTVIGCAMAFMLIVTILVIAICRVQIKRAMNSRWTPQNRTNCTRRRTVPIGMPIYDLDVYLNRAADNYPRGVSIMYNINSGVQFVGRPVEPPPYSEVIASPPREGPPPPYVSCENLVEQTTTAAGPTGAAVGQTESTAVETPNTDSTQSSDLREESTGVSGVVITSRSIPGPQVPTVSHISNDGGNANNRVGQSVPQTFDLEYVETDALLSEKSNVKVSSPKEAVWKGSRRPGLSKFRWENEFSGKRWYPKSNKSVESSPLRSRDLSQADSENEGVFLDTDQQEGTRQEPGPSTSHNTSTPNLDSKVVKVDKSNKRIKESGDSSGPTESDNRSSVNLDNNQEAYSTHPSQPQSPFHETRANTTESSTSMSTTLVPPSDHQTETNGQSTNGERLVLPLRESFIGVQRES